MSLSKILFREGYLRTSSLPYSTEQLDIKNNYIHLTNNAIQKYSDKYGSFEEGNQLSFDDFQKFIDNSYKSSKISMKEDLFTKMKNQIKSSCLSVKKKINLNNRHYCYELLGYDFIIDSNFDVLLIEVNTNPCLEFSSSLLSQYIPRLLNDAFKLTIDVLFP